MRIYAAADEERIHVQNEVRAWTSAGLLDPARGAAIEASLRTRLRRTNVMLRAVLAFFTMTITAAAIGLMFVTLGVNSQRGAAALVALSAIACVALAEAAVSRLRLYRYGVEEAWAGGGGLLAALSVGLAGSIGHLRTPQIPALMTAAVGATWIYHRFGFVYAPVAALIGAAAIPFQLQLPEPARRLAASAVLSVAAAAARTQRRRFAGTYREIDFEIAQAAAWAGAYVVMNLQLSEPILSGLRTTASGGEFYWFTFAAIWLLPAAGLTLAVRERTRPLLDVSIALALVTLATNKPYLGLAHRSWDPMALGVLLGGIAIGIRRWLASGHNGERDGFTPARIVVADRELLQTVANVSAGFQQHPAPPPAERPASGFGGGRSGGGGASGSY